MLKILNFKFLTILISLATCAGCDNPTKKNINETSSVTLLDSRNGIDYKTRIALTLETLSKKLDLEGKFDKFPADVQSFLLGKNPMCELSEVDLEYLLNANTSLSQETLFFLGECLSQVMNPNMAKDKSLLLLNKISKVSVLKSISNNNNFQDHLIKSRLVALSLNYLSQTAPNNEEILKSALEKKFKELNASISASFENLVPGYESEYYPQCGYLWSIAPYATGTENFDKKLSQMTDKIHTGLLSKEGNIKTTVSAVAYCIQASLDKNNYLKKAHLNHKETEILSVIMKDNFNLNANLNCVDNNRVIPWVNNPKTEAPLEKCIENGTFFHNLRIFQILNKVENLESMNF